LGLLILGAGCSPTASTPAGTGLEGEITLFHAGSLSVPVHRLTSAFHEEHPGVHFRTEAAGSRTTARKVSELGRQADVVMSADYSVIDSLLIPEYASWNVRFARNTMVIAYTEQSRYASEIDSRNWFRILQKEDVEFGHSDPDADPNGYRTLMVWQLAEIYYQESGLYRALDKASPPENIRPKETDLIALLQSGDLDYAFNYRSVAMQHDLKYVNLPDAINLGQAEYADTYHQAKVTLSGSEPGQSITRRGNPIVYGVTIPENARNPELAVEFLSFLLGPQGRSILAEAGQIPMDPPLSPHGNLLPSPLQDIVDLVDSR